MVNDLQPQIDNSFNHLIQLLNDELDINKSVSRYLQYVKEKKSLVQQSNDVNQVKEMIRGINRYSDEFEFTDTNAKNIKTSIELLYDLAN